MAKHSFEGSELSVSIDEGANWVEVAGITSADVPGPVRGEIEVTDSKSKAKEFIADIPDNGSWSFNLVKNDEDQGQIICQANAYGSAKNLHWRMTFPSGKTMLAQGYVNAFPDSGSNGAAYATAMGVRIVSEVTGTAIPAEA